MADNEMRIIADRWMMESRRIVNWGSYDGYHEFRPSMDHDLPVTLLAGASESGKSTLVDAQISLLYPTGTPFNKASNAGRSERSDFTYLYGMLGVSDTGDGDRPVYLRGGDPQTGERHPVWGAIADTYRNVTTGQTLSCGKFLYSVPGDARSDVRRQYITWNRPIDPRLMDEFRDAPFTPTMLKRAYDGCTVYSNAESFHTAIWRMMGLSAEACRLLHRIQSADAPSKLDDIFKQGVLGVPEALGLARAAVDDYRRYDENFRSMEEKARRVARLRDIETGYAQYTEALGRARTFDAVDPADAEPDGPEAGDPDGTNAVAAARGMRPSGAATLRAWALSRMAADVRRQLPRDLAAAAERRSAADSARRLSEDVQRRIDDVNAQIQGLDGGSLIRLESELAQAGRDVTDAKAARQRFEHRFDVAGEPMPDDETSWKAAQGRSEAFAATYETQLAQAENRQYETVSERSRISAERDQLQRDFTRQKTRRTRITQSMEDSRAMLAQATGLDVADLPYVAELMDVREEDERWRDAMNVTYGSIAQTILVDSRHEQGFAGRVSGIDPALMPRRTWRFVDVDRRYDTAPNAGRMSERLQYREDSPFIGWLMEQTSSERLDAWCVDRIDDADRGRRQVQADGQIKDGTRGWHGLKGFNPIIGFADEAYLTQLQQRIDRCDGRLHDAEAAFAQAKSAVDVLRARHELADRLADTEWEKVDVAGAERHVADLQAAIDAIKGDPELARLTALKADLQSKRIEADKTGYDAERDAEAARQAADAARAWLDGHAADDPGDAADDGGEHGITAPGPVSVNGVTLPAEVVAVLGEAYESAFSGVMDDADRPHLIIGAGQSAAANAASVAAGDTFERRVLNMVGRAVTARITASRSAVDTARAGVEANMATYLELYAPGDESVTAGVGDHRFYAEELNSLTMLTAVAATDEEYANSLDKLLMDFMQLARALDTDTQDINDQLERINGMLRGQEFGPRHGSLSIGANVRRPDAAFTGRFRRTLGRLNDWKQDARHTVDSARKTFASCAPFIDLLDQELAQVRDANGIKAYGARDLDPRCRSSFHAIVHHEDGDDERITSTGGKSGGALQELTSFVYGAALIYLLGGDVNGRPTYTTLFLDEALIKADGRYTQRALSVLPRLGFQVIVSAPESKTAEILEVATKAYVAYRDRDSGRSYLQEITSEQIEAIDAENAMLGGDASTDVD